MIKPSPVLIIASLCTLLAMSSRAQKRTEMAFITGIQKEGAYNIIEADFIQMLSGKAAVAAARRQGEAQYDIGPKEDTTWYVDNDYYIVNMSKKVRRYLLMPGAAIWLLKEGTSDIKQGNLAQLKKDFRNQMFKLYFERERLVRIEAVFTP
jgi:hypothetical protein